MKSDILDILFENRNKAYGAYDLRKFYTHRLKTALGFMMLISFFISAFTFLPEKSNRVIERIYNIPDTKLPTIKEKLKEQVKKTEIAKTETKATPVNQAKLVSKVVVVRSTEKTDTIKTIENNTVIGSINIGNNNLGPVFIQPVIPETGNGVVTTPKIDNTIPLDVGKVDEPPTYPGGMDALRKFLERNLNNPQELENGESVSVKMKFVVGYNGKLQSFTTILDGGEAFNKEVVRVLKKMPEWIPGKANGENVSVYYTIPVKFVSLD